MMKNIVKREKDFTVLIKENNYKNVEILNIKISF